MKFMRSRMTFVCMLAHVWVDESMLSEAFGGNALELHCLNYQFGGEETMCETCQLLPKCFFLPLGLQILCDSTFIPFAKACCLHACSVTLFGGTRLMYLKENVAMDE